MLRPRVYSKTDKKVLEVIEIDFDYKVIVVRGIDNSNNNIVGTLNFSDVEFMDNTGFKDKNGRYIYTGDIVKVNGWWDCIVKYNQPTCEFLLRSINGTWCLRDSAHFNNISSIEVLGNEYENKELLKLGITEIKSWRKYEMRKGGLKEI